MSDSVPSKDQLATYLEHCANLADKPLDGVAYVSVGKLREVVLLLRATHEPPAGQPTVDYLNRLFSGEDLPPKRRLTVRSVDTSSKASRTSSTAAMAM